MPQPEFRNGANSGSDDAPRVVRKHFQKLARSGHFMDSFGSRRLALRQLRELVLDTHIRGNQANSFDRAASVRGGNHVLGVEVVTRRPFAPRRLYAFRGINQHAVEIEEHRSATKRLHRRGYCAGCPKRSVMRRGEPGAGIVTMKM
jgi:hypothetical protein